MEIKKASDASAYAGQFVFIEYKNSEFETGICKLGDSLVRFGRRNFGYQTIFQVTSDGVHSCRALDDETISLCGPAFIRLATPAEISMTRMSYSRGDDEKNREKLA